MDRLASRLKSAFGLQRIPFTPEINGDFFLHPAFEEGLKKLRYVADRRGMALLVAGPGVGKSTLLRAFIESLGKTSFLVAYVPEATCGILDLYRAIAGAFGIDPALPSHNPPPGTINESAPVAFTQRACEHSKHKGIKTEALEFMAEKVGYSKNKKHAITATHILA